MAQPLDRADWDVARQAVNDASADVSDLIDVSMTNNGVVPETLWKTLLQRIKVNLDKFPPSAGIADDIDVTAERVRLQALHGAVADAAHAMDRASGWDDVDPRVYNLMALAKSVVGDLLAGNRAQRYVDTRDPDTKLVREHSLFPRYHNVRMPLGLRHSIVDGIPTLDMYTAVAVNHEKFGSCIMTIDAAGDPVGLRRFTFDRSREPVTRILAALMTTTWSPTSINGVYCGFSLPIRIRATREARRPSTNPLASTTNHLRTISPSLGK